MNAEHALINDGKVWTLPVLPVKNTVLYPYLFLPLSVGRSLSRAAVEAALASEDKTLVVLTQRDADSEQPGAEEPAEVSA